MKDYMVKATAANGYIRAFAANTKDLVEEAKNDHNTSPVATAALGRMLTAAAMMGSMMKGEKDLLTLKIEGDGPLGGVIATANNKGEVKGYPFNPTVIIPPNAKGKLDVAEAIGVGLMSVIMDTGMKEPYVGQVALLSGEIAEDLTYYYATSEQTPSSVGLGVLLNKDNTINAAGGFIIQLMPHCPDEIIDKLEIKINNLRPVTTMLSEGMSPNEILKDILGDVDLEFNESLDLCFKCNCDKERIEKALISVGEKELQEMIDDGKSIEVKCHFCNKAYDFNVNELKDMLKKATTK
ncbi:chaperonin HslO [Lachnoanaerobaculum sp. MSX33]|uniref:Hsp33 family molecular chaperone HslO n=1 Tax=Lachnoanaerobaculum sp. MSX33 TaxID=936596 RepID=UPI0003DF9A6F|nr:Hsp33 family molecular chaperone HslO [Lachnoanaerobaculum sp. MSX33]ETO98805.1 chaperonin HslO [Lachnoanaerobaculum sp. MSX33]